MKIVYYKDELNDEFSGSNIKPRKIDENYNYMHGKIWNAVSYFIQNILSMPIKYAIAKMGARIKYVGKEKMEPYKKQGFFIYGNHTQVFLDTFIPSIVLWPKRNFFIVNPENVSMKGSEHLIEMLGAMPIPEGRNINAYKNFLNAINTRIKEGKSITIYPEAHIWPYCTKIRNFKDVSFKYPVALDVPTFCFTNTYQLVEDKDKKESKLKNKNEIELKNKNRAEIKSKSENQKEGKIKEKFRIVTYIDGPFYPDEYKNENGIIKKLTQKEKVKNLRDKIYKQMVERSKLNTYEKIRYVKK